MISVIHVILTLSRNGTYINTEKIGTGNRRILSHGDTLHIIYKGKGNGTLAWFSTRLPTLAHLIRW